MDTRAAAMTARQPKSSKKAGSDGVVARGGGDTTPGGPDSGVAGNANVQSKISKAEKIARLEISLKLARDENRRLKKQRKLPQQQLQQQVSHQILIPPLSPKTKDASASHHSSGTTSTGGGQDVDKMKEALKALKRVTVQQEQSLQALREKSSARRNELEARDATILKLQKQLKSVASVNGGGGGDAGRVRQLEQQWQEAQGQNVELKEVLQATEMKVAALERKLQQQQQQHSQAPRRESKLGHCKSGHSTHSNNAKEGTTNCNAYNNNNVAVESEMILLLERELGVKSNRIVELEQELAKCKQLLQQYQKAAAAAVRAAASSKHHKSNNHHDEDDDNEDDPFSSTSDFGTSGPTDAYLHRIGVGPLDDQHFFTSSEEDDDDDDDETEDESSAARDSGDNNEDCQ